MSFFADFFLSVWKNVVFLQPQNGGTVDAFLIDGLG